MNTERKLEDVKIVTSCADQLIACYHN